MSRISTLEVYQQGRGRRLMPVHFCLNAAVEVRMQGPPPHTIGIEQYWAVLVGRLVELDDIGDSVKLCVEDVDDGTLNEFAIARDGFFWYRHLDSKFECAYVLTSQGAADTWLQELVGLKV